jgi:hypothetical protein
MSEDSKPTRDPKKEFRGNPIFDRFFSQIIAAVHQEDGAEAYETFLNALSKAAEGKARLGQY